MVIDKVFDAVVVGGGPAGLAAALWLARARRSVLLIDAGAGRAVRMPRSHDLPGFADGVDGHRLIASMQHQALRHGVHMAIGRVERLESAGPVFELGWTDARASARTVLLATGATDIAPIEPHLVDAIASEAMRYCASCDGPEIIDRVVGIVGDGRAGVDDALYLRDFTPHVTFFPVAGATPVGASDRARLVEVGVTVVDEPTTSVTRRHGSVVVGHGAGRELEVHALYCALGLRVHSALATRLGAHVDEQGCVVVDARQNIGVAGVYAAGDVVRGPNRIFVATGSAAIAATSMQHDLQAAGTNRVPA